MTEPLKATTWPCRSSSPRAAVRKCRGWLGGCCDEDDEEVVGEVGGAKYSVSASFLNRQRANMDAATMALERREM